MKWKCSNCSWGPCVYDGNCYPDQVKYFNRQHCFYPLVGAKWYPMNGEEPEQETESGLPEWLKEGSFVWLDAGFMSIKNPEYHGVPRGIYKIISIKSDSLMLESINDRGNGYFKIPWGDADEIRRLSMRPVYPKPYTFETAPVAFKVRRKDGMNAILDLCCRNDGFQGFAIIAPGFGGCFVSFADALRVYEQLDGWPCGTFDEDGGNEK